MNRPPKNKNNKDDLLADPRFDKEDLAQEGKQPQEVPQGAAGDDRNLVGVEEAFKEADFEEKMWMLWNDNKTAIMSGALVVLFAVVGFQVFRWYQEDSVRKMQAAYAAANDEAAKLAFAASHNDKALSGVGLLSIADEKYAADAFTEAATLYSQAADALQGHLAQGRAMIGQGVALIRAEDIEGGKLVLNELAGGKDFLQSYKAEAIYHLASIAVQDKQYDEAKLLISQMETLDYAGIWASQLDGIKRSKPELNSEENE